MSNAFTSNPFATSPFQASPFANNSQPNNQPNNQLALRDTHGYFRSSELYRLLPGLLEESQGLLKPSLVKRVLEIGTYEGVFSCLAAEIWPEAQIHTIDPFLVSDPGTRMTQGTEANFLYNLSQCPGRDRVTQHRMFSQEFFEAWTCDLDPITSEPDYFDFIYVDGSHEPEDALRDLDWSLRAIRKPNSLTSAPTDASTGGVIWIDDYGSNYKTLSQIIDQWLRDNAKSIRIVHKGYQVGLAAL